jgi:hypothetical protein
MNHQSPILDQSPVIGARSSILSLSSVVIQILLRHNFDHCTMARSLQFFIFLLICIECRSLVHTSNQKGNAARTLISTSSEAPLLFEQNIEKDDDCDLFDESVRSRRAFLGAMLSAGAFVSFADLADAKEDNLSSSESIAEASAASVDWEEILQKASKKALGSGKAGASAAVVQVFSLMWLRTCMNYQYRYGGTLTSSLQLLWAEGGLPRLYQGLPFALVQGPLSKFGDTAANVGILALLETLPAAQGLPLPLKTACGSAAAGLWRIVLMPVDASKTALQVEGADGLNQLWASVLAKGPGPLYRGAVAQAAATAVGHFPWFLTYNFLDGQIPEVSAADDLFLSLARAAFLGLCASCVSDTASNSLRVIKTTKQTAQLGATSEEPELSYGEVVAMILETDGLVGLFGRGLQTRLLTNAIQGSLFSVLWRYFQ